MHYSISDDGKKFVNAYSKASTPLGLVLSNFFYYPFECEKGYFPSVESLWHYLRYEGITEAEEFHQLEGAKAKAYADELKQRFNGQEIIRDDLIYEAIWKKVQHFRKLFLAKYRDLPIVHFYVYNGVAVPVKEASAWLRELNKMKQCIYEGTDYKFERVENLNSLTEFL